MLTADYNIYMNTQQAINLEIFRRFAEEKIELAHRARVFQLMTPPAASSSGGAPNVRAVTAERAFSTRSGCGAPRAFVPE